MDLLFSARQPIPDDSQQKKKTCQIGDFAVLADLIVKLKVSEKRDKYHDLAREIKQKTMELRGDGGTNWNSQQRIGKGTWRLGNKIRDNH